MQQPPPPTAQSGCWPPSGATRSARPPPARPTGSRAARRGARGASRHARAAPTQPAGGVREGAVRGARRSARRGRPRCPPSSVLRMRRPARSIARCSIGAHTFEGRTGGRERHLRRACATRGTTVSAPTAAPRASPWPRPMPRSPLQQREKGVLRGKADCCAAVDSVGCAPSGRGSPFSSLHWRMSLQSGGGAAGNRRQPLD